MRLDNKITFYSVTYVPLFSSVRFLASAFFRQAFQPPSIKFSLFKMILVIIRRLQRTILQLKKKCKRTSVSRNSPLDSVTQEYGSLRKRNCQKSSRSLITASISAPISRDAESPRVAIVALAKSGRSVGRWPARS